ncbi:hypothetical protein Nepgr_025339 [Nepenthes gracilis]|uniref:Uncharacterized protein n=1 Tax=Nepenthes gracilis TaxID=150966 RepID=A0AAD3T7L4_NEPGR|nr:hypothetical protein Nepgr_025339 [Nepenthes gracilis]
MFVSKLSWSCGSSSRWTGWRGPSRCLAPLDNFSLSPWFSGRVSSAVSFGLENPNQHMQGSPLLITCGNVLLRKHSLACDQFLHLVLLCIAADVLGMYGIQLPRDSTGVILFLVFRLLVGGRPLVVSKFPSVAGLRWCFHTPILLAEWWCAAVSLDRFSFRASIQIGSRPLPAVVRLCFSKSRKSIALCCAGVPLADKPAILIDAPISCWQV